MGVEGSGPFQRQALHSQSAPRGELMPGKADIYNTHAIVTREDELCRHRAKHVCFLPYRRRKGDNRASSLHYKRHVSIQLVLPESVCGGRCCFLRHSCNARQKMFPIVLELIVWQFVPKSLCQFFSTHDVFLLRIIRTDFYSSSPKKGEQMRLNSTQSDSILLLCLSASASCLCKYN